MPNAARFVVTALIAAAAALPPTRGAGAATAQIPEEFTNLEILPEDISRDSLVSVMRGFALGLGVRCHYCHVGEEGLPFSDWDFPSDEKPEKRKARFMLEMVRYLNEERLPRLGPEADAARRDPPVRVSCETCHHGLPVPRPLEEVLALTLEEEGLDSTIAEYRRLRAEYHGTGAYDFGELRLADLSEMLLRGGKLTEAAAILRLNLEHHPESVRSLILLSDAHLAVGDREAARAALERARALAPNHPIIARKLEALQ